MYSKEEKKKAWDFALGMIKVDGLEPSEDFKELIEKEKRGEITTEEMREYLNKKYTVPGVKK